MGKTNGSHIKDGLPKPPFQAIIGACAGESYIRLHVAAEGKPPLSLDELVKEELIRYSPFPDALKGKYQSYTKADISRLRDAGYQDSFYSVEEGVSRYVQTLLAAA